MSSYLEMMKELINKRNIETKKGNKEIARLYRDMYYDYRNELSKVKPGSLKEVWIKDQMKALGNSMQELGRKEKDIITKEMESIINATTKMNEDYLNKAAEKYGFPKDLFTNTFSKMNTDILRELVSGGIYKDRKGLSHRIWKDTKQFDKDIDYVIKEGLSKKRSIYDLAKDLEKYVDPSKRKDYEWKKLYPGAGKKVVDYNAYRLANTSITHAYQTALARVNKQNPFMEGIEWVGGSHARSCELCKERNGHIYGAKQNKGKFTTDPLPLDHPNGFCNNIPVVEDLSAVGDRLNKWVNGKDDPGLDKWFKEHGDKYKGPDDIKKAPPKEDKKPKEEKKPKPKKDAGRDDAWYDKKFRKLKDQIPSEHWNSIRDKIKNAPEFVQDWWARGADKFKYAGTDGKQAYYQPGLKHIKMDFKADQKNTRGAYSTFFHEYGHLIDHRIGTWARADSHDQEFYGLLQDDLNNRIKKYMDLGCTEEKAKQLIKNKLMSSDDYINAVSDITGGLTNNKIMGQWGHSKSYWSRYEDRSKDVCSEMWAHMSAAHADPKAYKLIEEYYPQSLAWFNEVIKKHGLE